MSNVNDTSNLHRRDNRKNEADKLTTNENSREKTADELNQVVGGAIQWTYTKQKADGTAGGNVAGGWDLIANKVHA